MQVAFLNGLRAAAATIVMAVAPALAQPADAEALLTQLFQLGQRSIEPSNWHCEGNTERTVAALLASVAATAMARPNTGLTMTCEAAGSGERICSLFAQTCTAQRECAQRILRFGTRNTRIAATSIACIDVP